jgi:hypothetical protein
MSNSPIRPRADNHERGWSKFFDALEQVVA